MTVVVVQAKADGALDQGGGGRAAWELSPWQLSPWQQHPQFSPL